MSAQEFDRGPCLFRYFSAKAFYANDLKGAHDRPRLKADRGGPPFMA